MTREFKSTAKILLIEEDTQIQESVRLVCEEGTTELIASRSYSEALSLALIHSPDIIVIGINTLEDAGTLLLRRMMRAQHLKDTLIVILTEDDSRNLNNTCLKLGATMVIKKAGCLRLLGERFCEIAALEAARNLCKKTSALLRYTQKSIETLGSGLVVNV